MFQIKEFQSFIIGTVLGDSSLCGRKNKYFFTGHCEKQYDYLMWKKSIIEKNLSVGVRVVRSDKMTCFNNSNRQPFYKLFTTSHHKLTSLYNKLYNEHGKIHITKELLENLTPLGLATFFMDDGCKESSWNKTKEYRVIRRYSFCLGNFSYDEACIFSQWLLETHDIESTVYLAKNKYPTVKISTSPNRIKFVNLISPYLIDSMKYKLFL